MISPNAISYRLDATKRSKIQQILLSDGGEILIDAIIDDIVTNPDLPPEERAGAGRILALMRSIRNDTGIETPKN